MTVLWNKEFDPSQVVTRIESSRKLKENGEVEFEGWGLQDYISLIYSMLSFSDNLSESDARQFIFKAIFTNGAKGSITVQNLLSEINRLDQKYQSSPIERFVLATTISIDDYSIIQNIRLGRTQIIFEQELSKKFHRFSNPLMKHAEEGLFAKLPNNYLNVRVHISSKSARYAAEQALEAIDFVRGVWNWSLNRRHPTRMSFGGKPKPVNNIILGPVHTIHKPNGKLAINDTWWYEPSYLGSIQPFNATTEEVEKMNNILNHVIKVLNKHKYRPILQNAIIRYTRALDERDWTTSFNKL